MKFKLEVGKAEGFVVQKNQMSPVAALTSVASSSSLSTVASRPTPRIVLTTSPSTAVPTRRSRLPLAPVCALPPLAAGQVDHDTIEEFANRYRNQSTVRPA